MSILIYQYFLFINFHFLYDYIIGEKRCKNYTEWENSLDKE